MKYLVWQLDDILHIECQMFICEQKDYAVLQSIEELAY